VHITDDGRRLTQEIRHRREAWLSTRLDALAPDDLAKLADALDVLERLVEVEQP
jgi:hypothetical protein